jgi:hypothetical protein
MHKFAFYECWKCKRPYFGGDFACALAANEEGVESDPSELFCGGCAPSSVSNCALHGREYIEFKCRYCCSVATFFCWGRTHFCRVCHRNSLELTSMKKADLACCPCRPKGHTGLPVVVAVPSLVPAGEARGGSAAVGVVEGDGGGGGDGDGVVAQVGDKSVVASSCGGDVPCPLLGTVHPPTGEEHCLGCGMCRTRPPDATASITESSSIGSDDGKNDEKESPNDPA